MACYQLMNALHVIGDISRLMILVYHVMLLWRDALIAQWMGLFVTVVINLMTILPV